MAWRRYLDFLAPLLLLQPNRKWYVMLSISHPLFRQALTRADYWHLTKRFGIVGASQLPFHYLLAVKTPYSPLQILTRSSHEQLNAVHQVLGRIVVLLFSLHALFYLNGFVQMGNLAEKLTHTIIIIGLVSVFLFNLIGTTALAWVRARSYRIFYGVHVIVAAVLLPLLYFHVHHIRTFIWETLAVYILHAALRFLSQRTYDGSVSLVPDTNLIRVDVQLPSAKGSKAWHPGQHVYLKIPHHQSVTSTAMAQLKEAIGLRSNPFTVTSLPSLDQKLVLIARAMKGNTKELAGLAHYLSSSSAHEATKIPLKVEGPYGASAWLPDLQSFDSILLVAGGVGATFIIPIWRSICMSRTSDGRSLADRVRFVWAVRRMSETTWAFPSAEASSALPHATRGVEVFVTRGGEVDDHEEVASSSRTNSKAREEQGEDIEMSEREHLMSNTEEGKAESRGLIVTQGRPRLGRVVDDTFDVPGARVAVLTCGPQGMTTELRKDVGRWVAKGRDVFWHAEAFGL